MDHMRKIVLPRIPHFIADSMEMRGDEDGAKNSGNKKEMVERFMEVLQVEDQHLMPEERKRCQELDWKYRVHSPTLYCFCFILVLSSLCITPLIDKCAQSMYTARKYASATKARKTLARIWEPLLKPLTQFRAAKAKAVSFRNRDQQSAKWWFNSHYACNVICSCGWLAS